MLTSKKEGSQEPPTAMGSSMMTCADLFFTWRSHLGGWDHQIGDWSTFQCDLCKPVIILYDLFFWNELKQS